MEPDRFERLRNLVLSVADLPNDARQVRLAELCNGDLELLCEAREMLAHDTGPADILAPPAADLGYPDPLLACGTISHYRILERAGVGGMGVVYKAEDLALKRTVALKFLPLTLANDPEARARFTREAQAAAVLDHPNICTVHGIEEFEGASFIAMAYIEGETLTAKIRQGPLELTKALTIAIQVAEGLTAAHAKGVIHRDIKPGNILLACEGGAKITDFGLARIAGESAITSTGTRMGTGAYMSPEQARGETVDHRTDIWSLGVVLYEMVTGRRPFTGEREESVLYKLVHEDPPPMHDLRGDVPPELERLVAKAMAKSPDERYQQMDDMLADLRIARRYAVAGVWPASIHPSSAPRASVGTMAWLAYSAKRMIVPMTKRRKLVAIAAGGGITAAIAGALLVAEKHADVELDPHRVVVAAFDNRTGDESLDYLGPLVAERIVEQLVQVGPTRMTPAITPSVASAAILSSPAGLPDMRRLKALARESKAATAVSGSYSVVGDSVRFLGSVTDVRTHRLICALPAVIGHRSNPDDAIAMVTQRSAGGVAAHFNPEARLDPGLPPPLFDAYREFMTGLGVWAEGVDYAEAFRHFTRAIELDSTFVTPYFWVSACYHNRGMYAESEALIRLLERYRDRLAASHRCMLDNWLSELGGRRAEAWRHLRQAEKAAPHSYVIKQLLAQEAVQQNHPREALERFAAMAHPESVYTYGLSGWWQFSFLTRAHHLLGNYQQELEVARSAREYFPDLLEVRIDEARALAGLGRTVDAMAAARACVAMPGAGYALLEIGRELRVHGHAMAADSVVNQAVAWYQNQRAERGATEGIRYGLGRALYAAGRWDEARVLFEELAKEHPDDIDYMGYLGVIAARTGERERALSFSSELQALDRLYLFGWHTYWRACIAAQLGDVENAVSLLAKAFGQGVTFGGHVPCDPDLDPLRNYPPFQELVRPKG